MSDTPITPVTFPRPPMMDRVKGLIGDLARPFAVYVTSGGAAIAMVIIATKVDDGMDGAATLVAIAGLVGGIYGFKAWENNTTAKAAANVEIAKAAPTPEPEK